MKRGDGMSGRAGGKKRICWGGRREERRGEIMYCRLINVKGTKS